MDNQKLVVSGAIAGFATPYLLKYAVMPILNVIGNFAPTFSLKLANPEIAINIRESLTGLDGSIAGWLMDVFNMTIPSSMLMTALMGAVGGALLFLAGGYLAETLGLLKGDSAQKSRAVIFLGSIVAGVAAGAIGLPPQLNIGFVNILVAFAVNAAILAVLFVWIDKELKIGISPY